uniref:Uncharacterized protein n=1 Tax=Anguilla anguilla TaxID=7936 RepID=A0A0E9SEP4_ANGAN
MAAFKMFVYSSPSLSTAAIDKHLKAAICRYPSPPL